MAGAAPRWIVDQAAWQEQHVGSLSVETMAGAALLQTRTQTARQTQLLALLARTCCKSDWHARASWRQAGAALLQGEVQSSVWRGAHVVAVSAFSPGQVQISWLAQRFPKVKRGFHAKRITFSRSSADFAQLQRFLYVHISCGGSARGSTFGFHDKLTALSGH